MACMGSTIHDRGYPTDAPAEGGILPEWVRHPVPGRPVPSEVSCLVPSSSGAPAPRSASSPARWPASAPWTSAASPSPPPSSGPGLARPGRLRLHGPGPPGRPGPDHRPPGRRQGRDPDVGPGHHHQQGLPVGAQHHLPGRPDDRGRRGRRRGGRGHGVDDQGPVPAARGPGRLPAGRRHAGRLDDVRRPLLRSSTTAPWAWAPSATTGQPKISRERQDASRRCRTSGPRRHQGRPLRRRDRPGVGPPAQGRPHRRRHRRGACGPGRRPSRSGPCARLRQGGHHHRRQRQPDLRRRRRRHRDVGGQGRRARRHPARRGRRLRPGGRPRRLPALPAGQRHRQALDKAG
jgi:hypothetical protein